MAKSSFSSKSNIIDQKTVKNDQNLMSKSGVKIGHNLTTKRGDSGSAGMLEEKCVINQAPKFDTKITQNWSPT